MRIRLATNAAQVITAMQRETRKAHSKAYVKGANTAAREGASRMGAVQRAFDRQFPGHANKAFPSNLLRYNRAFHSVATGEHRPAQIAYYGRDRHIIDTLDRLITGTTQRPRAGHKYLRVAERRAEYASGSRAGQLRPRYKDTSGRAGEAASW